MDLLISEIAFASIVFFKTFVFNVPMLFTFYHRRVLGTDNLSPNQLQCFFSHVSMNKLFNFSMLLYFLISKMEFINVSRLHNILRIFNKWKILRKVNTRNYILLIYSLSSYMSTIVSTIVPDTLSMICEYLVN